jgi:hypothetical protein
MYTGPVALLLLQPRGGKVCAPALMVAQRKLRSAD